jgi:zinc finger protein DZIP1
MPLPPKLRFVDKVGRIDWRTITEIDVEQLTREPNLPQLQKLLQNLTYSKLDYEDMERMGDSHFVKLFRLSQLSLEYLIYT